MLHLDEGILTALLDGELTGTQQREAEAHLRICAECSARLTELRSLMSEADQLVESLNEPLTPGRAPAVSTVRRRRTFYHLSWAASIVAMVGLGLAGLQLLRPRVEFNSPSAAVTQAPSKSQISVDSAPPNQAAAPAELAERNALSSRGAGDSAERDAQGEGLRANANTTDPQESRERTAGRLAADSLTSREEAIIAVHPGVVTTPSPGALSIRGERSDSVATYIDGVAVKSGYRGTGFRSAPSGQVAQAPSGAVLRDSVGDFAAKSSALAEAAAPLVPRDEVSAKQRMRGDYSATDSTFHVIAKGEAEQLMAGPLRLIEGLTPERFEAGPAPQGIGMPVIRVVYSIRSPMQAAAGSVLVFLDQQRIGNDGATIGVNSLTAPSRLDLAQRSMTNVLQWNDLGGHVLILRSSLPADSLVQLKARIR